MTREEAILIIGEHKKNAERLAGKTLAGQKSAEAFNTAIEALYAETCDDCISREAVIEALNSIDGTAELDKAFEVIENMPSLSTLEIPNKCEDAISREEAIRIASGYCHWSNIPDELAKLPSVQPKARWVPVSERLPEFDVPVLVYQTYYKGNAITIGRYHSDEEQGGYKYWQWIMYDSWFSYGIEHFGIICPNSDFVEAWMPLPKPYKAESEDTE